jgi:hypothetical protein
MSYIMSMFLRDAQLILPSELSEFISDGVYFDDPVFKHDPPDSADSENWVSLDVNFDPERRPITFWNEVDPKKIADLVEGVAEDLPKNRTGPVVTRVLRDLKSARRVISSEFNHESMSEDGWDMLDRLQHHLLSKYGGILYAPNDGFYVIRDSLLQQLMKL